MQSFILNTSFLFSSFYALRFTLFTYYESTEMAKKRIKIIRGLNKKRIDAIKSKEGIMYEGGGFS